MAKTLITDSFEGTTTPFLRGILTRSLTDAGLSFESAYQLSSEIRQQISNKPDISTQELRRLVLSELKKLNETDIIEAYESSSQVATIKVCSRSGVSSPFSRIEHRRSLTSTGLSADKASFITQSLYQQLADSMQEEVQSDYIGKITYEELKRQFGKEAAKRYLVWIDYKRGSRPLILLIGGTTGCGKSTIATEVAHRLGIIRTQSTDMLREVMRMLIPERLLPALHTSSFNAWRKMPSIKEVKEITEELMINGYLHQSELLSVPCEAVVHRALNERVSLIVEGVHIHPALTDRFKQVENAVIVPIMLAVLKQDKLKLQLKGRGVTSPKRSEESKYLTNFECIWLLQSYLLSEADNSTMHIIENNDKEKTTDRVMRSIIEVLQKDFNAKADDIFNIE
ncbi:MAG: zeta toxin family protein [Candidatus Thiodiazotropha sp. (ex Myrtea spinifera)]|nr:zeta toxin family protein [Candidatus Thiodiazotropha sp. (ex Myrtea spinifera)]MCU7829271.1 zeta toxin family protein [Candidatus Thiodiazotropha sp. (ex Myrtea sp. 'scaly one' KF741663)]